MQSEKRSQLMEKIRKLMALAESGRGATEEEAKSAMEIANKLMASYGISLGEITDEEIKEEIAVLEEAVHEYIVSENWQYTLLTALSKFYDVYLYYHQREMPVLVGSRADIESFKYMLSYLNRTIKSAVKGDDYLAGLSVSDVVSMLSSGHKLSNIETNYSAGMAERLAERLGELKTKRDIEMGQYSKALVVVDKKKRNIDDFMREHHPHMGHFQRGRDNIAHAARLRGRQVGDSVNLGGNRGVSYTRKIGYK